MTFLTDGTLEQAGLDALLLSGREAAQRDPDAFVAAALDVLLFPAARARLRAIWAEQPVDTEEERERVHPDRVRHLVQLVDDGGVVALGPDELADVFADPVCGESVMVALDRLDVAADVAAIDALDARNAQRPASSSASRRHDSPGHNGRRLAPSLRPLKGNGGARPWYARPWVVPLAAAAGLVLGVSVMSLISALSEPDAAVAPVYEMSAAPASDDDRATLEAYQTCAELAEAGMREEALTACRTAIGLPTEDVTPRPMPAPRALAPAGNPAGDGHAEALAQEAKKAVLSNPQRAVELYQQALSLFPEQVSWRAGLAFALERAGHVCEAVEAYRKVVDKLTGAARTRAQRTIDRYQGGCAGSEALVADATEVGKTGQPGAEPDDKNASGAAAGEPDNADAGPDDAEESGEMPAAQKEGPEAADPAIEAEALAARAKKQLMSSPRQAGELYEEALALVYRPTWHAEYAFALERSGQTCKAWREYRKVVSQLTGKRKVRAERSVAKYADDCSAPTVMAD